MTVSRVDALPHGLDLVIAFVNTRDIESETDELTTPAALAAWLEDRGLLMLSEGGERISDPQLEQALMLRESLRVVLGHHNEGGATVGWGLDRATRELERVAERGRLSVRFSADGSIDLAPRAHGFAGVLAQLLVPVGRAAADGTWQRVKACRADDCQWAFYDRSRNRSGRWCAMAVCGNRTKVRAYRSKRP